MYYVVMLIISIIFGLLLRAIAGKRGANQAFWFVMGFVFGPFALPFVFLARRKYDLESPLNEHN